MGTVRQLISGKTGSVATIAPEATVLEAARVMNDRRIGALVVVGEGAVPVGIVTERDVMTRVVAKVRDPAATTVSAIMTQRVITCAPETTVGELRTVMHERRIRHVPVLEGNRLVGMVSIGDLNAAEAGALVETIRVLEAYISQG
jgi:CBS domain-containing protein